jgi:hypothetical protein
MNILPLSHWKDRPEWVEQLVKRANYVTLKRMVTHVLWAPHLRENSKFLLAIIEKITKPIYGDNRRDVVELIMKNPYLRSHQQVLEILLKKKYITKSQAYLYGLESTSSKLLRNCNGLFVKLFGGALVV